MAKNATVYIGNAPYDTTEQELRDLFSTSETPRKINRVTMVTDKETGRPRGFSFIEFASAEDATSAVEAIDGTQFGGRTLKVSIARERERNDGGQDRRRRDR